MANTYKPYILLNCIIQLIAIFLYQYLGIVWGLYVTAFLLSGLSFTFLVASSFLLSGMAKGVPITKEPKSVLLASLIYLVSCYHIYLIGHPLFAGFVFGFLLIQISTVLLKMKVT